jgi:hypothetical protein
VLANQDIMKMDKNVNLVLLLVLHVLLFLHVLLIIVIMLTLVNIGIMTKKLVKIVSILVLLVIIVPLIVLHAIMHLKQEKLLMIVLVQMDTMN